MIMKKKLFLAGLGILGLCFFAAALWIVVIVISLPDVSVLKAYRPPAASEILDKDGRIITHFSERKFRIWIPVSSIPDIVIRSVVTAEDDTFFGHKGVNYRATWNALVHDVRQGRFARGGSTITQQMIKNVLLSREKTVTRKAREYFLARRAEEVLTKRRIIEIYLNEVEWGENIYGIEAASRYYFDKHAEELTSADAALLAGMLPNPRYFNPLKRPDKARERQERVLFNMFQAKILTEAEYQAALAAQPALRNGASGRFDVSVVAGGNGRPCYQKELERMMVSFYGEQHVYRRGTMIRTTLDKSLQDSIAALTAQDSGHGQGLPERIIVLREGMEIRAIACSEDEDAIRFFTTSLGIPHPEYEINTVDAAAISREAILLPVATDAGNKPE